MLLHRVGRLLAAILVHISFAEAVAIAAFYGLISYSGLTLAGETAITANVIDFLYWLIVTASTVGYGDMSPSTPAAKLFVSVFVIPIGLSLFAMLLTRFGYFLTYTISQRYKGLAMIDDKNHCLIIGWTPNRTKRLIELLASENNGLDERIVLCSEEQHENPLPADVEFVKVESFLSEEEMQRCGLAYANRIVIDLSSDDVTLTTALLCQKLNPRAHKTAYFQDDNIGKLLKQHCPEVEIIPSVSIELLARSTLDPGSSSVHQQLLDSTAGVNQFTKTYQGHNHSFGALFTHYKNTLNATLIGFRKKSSNEIYLNANLNEPVETGDSLFYYAATRVDHMPYFKEQPDE